MSLDERIPIGEILIQRGNITRDQLNQALDFQLRSNTHKSLGAILVEDFRWITDHQRKEALHEQSQFVRYPIGLLLVQQGNVTPQQLARALTLQFQEAPRRRLGEILIELGIVSRDQLDQALREQKKR